MTSTRPSSSSRAPDHPCLRGAPPHPVPLSSRRVGLLLLSLVLAFQPPVAAEPTASPRPVQLLAGFTQTAFQGVNRADAETAFKVLSHTVGRRRGYQVDVKVRLFERTDELEAALRAGVVNLLILDAWTFCQLEADVPIEPAFFSSDGERVTKQQLILTRRDGALDSMASLRGKSLSVQFASNASLGFHWLKVALAEQKLGTIDSFFGSTDSIAKPMPVVLSVIFGQKDACLVDSAGFALMTELNPTVAGQLRIIATSEPLAAAVVCLSPSGWASAQFRMDTFEALGELHGEPAGQQVLTLFRSGRLVPFEEQHLTTLRALQASEQRLSEEAKP